MRRFSLFTFALLAAAPVLAAEGHSIGLPQLDPAPLPGQLFWLAINFILIWQILARLAVPALTKLQNNRQAHFTALRQRAEELRQEAQRNQSDAMALTEQAYKQTHQMMVQLAMQLQDEANRRNRILEEDLDERIASSMDRIESARLHAQESLVDSSTLLVPAILQKVTGQHIPASNLTSQARALMGMLSPDENRLRRA